MIQACRELGVAFVPFSPLARGVFGQNYPDIQAMAKTDFRAAIPRFNPTITPAILPSLIGSKPMPRIGA